MVHVRSLLLVTAGLVTKTQAYSLGADPVLVRGEDGTTILDENNMVYGAIIPPVKYKMTDGQGSPIEFNSTEVMEPQVDTKMEDGDHLESAYSQQENYDLYYLERAYNTQFVRNADQINQNWKRGAPQKTAWPGSYWPTFQDGINYRWDNGAPSPAEKYARATGQDVATFMNLISARNGADSQPGNARCVNNAQCAQGFACAIRDGRNWGYCIATWTGICHAWAPAAILEQEPRCSVTVNGVTFKAMDIKALITQFYDGAGISVINAGLRNWGNDANRKDPFGRFVDYSHRDINPAVLHIALANIMGRFGQNFVVDVDAGPEVWNQPIRSYEFSDPYVMNPNDAANYFFRTPSYAVFNPNTVRVHYIRNTFRYVGEGYQDGGLSGPGTIEYFTKTLTYDYLLELDAYNNIIGGEWVSQSSDQHTDFLWVPLTKPNPNAVSNVGISYQFVSYLIQQSANSMC